MNLKEYKEWLEKNANQEEKMAYEVAERIIDYHTDDNYHDWKAEVYPRKVLVRDLIHKQERLEFDLVIKIEWTSNRKYERLIGVEFKEYDMDKVVVQAIARRHFVDYMYIATRNVSIDPVNLLRLVDFGIGWVVWSDFVKLIFPSKFNRFGHIDNLLHYLAKKAIEEEIEKMKLESKIARNMKLFEFG